MGFPIVKYNQNLTKGLDKCVQYNWVYLVYSVMLIYASFLSSYSPFSLIPNEASVKVSDFP